MIHHGYRQAVRVRARHDAPTSPSMAAPPGSACAGRAKGVQERTSSRRNRFRMFMISSQLSSRRSTRDEFWPNAVIADGARPHAAAGDPEHVCPRSPSAVRTGCLPCSAASHRSACRSVASWERPSSRQTGRAGRCPTDLSPGVVKVAFPHIWRQARSGYPRCFSSHPPKRVPFGCSMGQENVLPLSLTMPIPQGLDSISSALPSPS